MSSQDSLCNGIAIVGMAGRFPGARTIDEFWENLTEGVDTTTFLTTEELLAAGVPSNVITSPNYVRAAFTLEDSDRFDADFFDFSPAEAEILDPQQRLFLQACWHALEDAGYPPAIHPQPFGVFGSTSVPSYQLVNLANHPLVANTRYGLDLSGMQVMFANAPDYLATRVSYKLNLCGPSVTVQTACSSSLVAVHQACQSLWGGECDLALAGGVSIKVPQRVGYFFEEGSIVSPDGRCRAFDEEAGGTVFGSGVGVVALKRMSDALAAADHIYAVILGTAVNNDGAAKASYTAPSVDAQAQVIAEALEMSNVPASTVGYLEAHGTGTHMGDPIEVAALTKAFRGQTQRTQFCALGSVKTNVGHLDVAAGIAGLIKAALVLQQGVIPPSLHYRRPNPVIDFGQSPFFVNTALTRWAPDGPRRAGVTSLGAGGTNVHAVLEQAPSRRSSGTPRSVHVLTLSARTDDALSRASQELADYVDRHPDLELSDIAFTQHLGRADFLHRRSVEATDLETACRALIDPAKGIRATAPITSPPVIFAFPGQGAQHLGMAQGCYQAEPIFRESVDECAEMLVPLLGLDLREVMWPGEHTPSAAQRLRQTNLAQPALFTIEYSLARLWRHWGIEPRGLIGHSIGEYAAACLAGVFSPADALEIVAERGRLMQSLPKGLMLSVSLPEEDLLLLLSDHYSVSIAAVNEAGTSVISGSIGEIGKIEQMLFDRSIHCVRLNTSHAFHSHMMDPILDEFADFISDRHLCRPHTPFISGVTGRWILADEAVDPAYWARQLREPVRFADGLRCALSPDAVFLEVGPGRTLGSLGQRAPDEKRAVLSSLPHPHDPSPDLGFLHRAVGGLWANGASLDWDAYHAGFAGSRVSLPGYPFERKRFWYDAGEAFTPHEGSTPGHRPTVYERPVLETVYRQPSGATETQLAGLIASVLRMDSIGVDDNLFDLGVDSVMAVQIASRGMEHGMTLTPRQIFVHPTIRELATQLTMDRVGPLEDEVLEPLELTDFQEWALSYGAERAAAWAQVAVIHLGAHADPEVIRELLTDLIARYDALRLRFSPTSAGWRQRVLSDPGPLPFDVLRASAAHTDPVIDEAVLAATSRLSLSQGPLCWVTLIQDAAPKSDALVLVLNRLVADDTSLGILLANVQEALSHLKGAAPIAPAPFRAWLTGQQPSLRWSDQTPVSPAPPTNSLMSIDPSLQFDSSYLQRFLVPADLATVALALALRDVTGRCRWVFVSPRSAREESPPSAQSVGAILSTCYLIIDLEEKPDLPSLLASIKEQRVTAAPQPESPEILLDWAESLPPATISGFGANSCRRAVTGLGLPLEVWLTRDADELRGLWFFNTDLGFNASPDSIISAFHQQFAQVLRECSSLGPEMYAPMDFPDAGLDGPGLHDLLAEFGLS